MNDYIVINTRQLQYIIGKCKSSINNGIQAIGYVLVPTTAEIAIELGKIFPFLKNNFSEMRQWTVRKLRTQEEVPVKVKQAPITEKLDIFDFNPFNLNVENAYPDDTATLSPVEVPYISDQFFVDQDPLWFHYH
ncbi:potassium/sodium hyperpolarization-activated cyclic nucleotide-gated channel 1 [Histomonas meleagridis]|uniref:potassium/sodium hyperpolarization-activated cyclic nucleotide-gated channel 1 n=1 Tax=Histomonas meleagridis TaxID=135588 RepID=UPI0035598573|nr:potassium/sodium hyperpolarization-activated cyclic nucleotide-gated channel 1 [Histomonas meleagridis]KAH0798250.1 potassium/sodium hyperpolarization-activated cyclic nucleotide-gated channel 1 [Histomonas meleagridis]